MHVVVGVMVSKRPLIRFLRVEVFSLISLPFDSTLLIKVIISLLHLCNTLLPIRDVTPPGSPPRETPKALLLLIFLKDFA